MFQMFCTIGLVILITTATVLMPLHSHNLRMPAMISSKVTTTQVKSSSGVFNLLRPVESTTYLHQSCYQYANLDAINICCQARNYTSSSDLHICALKDAQALRQYQPPHDVTHSNQAYWVFNGNSRVRQLFNAMCRIFNADGNVLNGYGKIMNCENLTGHSTNSMAHTNLPINFTAFWDPLLEDLPWRINRWLKHPNERPTRLHIGIGVNFMKYSKNQYNTFGPEAAARNFETAVKKVVPGLKELSKYTHVSWWISEYTLKIKVYPQLRNVWSRTNINYYNKFLKGQLNNSNIAIMDAHVPLGELYLKSCTDHYVFDKVRCGDVVHHGKAVYQQYALMFLNYACNNNLEPDYQQKYCK